MLGLGPSTDEGRLVQSIGKRSNHGGAEDLGSEELMPAAQDEQHLHINTQRDEAGLSAHEHNESLSKLVDKLKEIL